MFLSISDRVLASLFVRRDTAVTIARGIYLSEETTTRTFLIGDDLIPEKKLDRRFIGTVEIDQIEQGDRGERWHLGVLPEGFDLGIDEKTGAPKCFSTWIPWTGEVPNEKSTAGRVIASMQAANLRKLDGSRYAPAIGELRGVRGFWDRVDIDYGVDRKDKTKRIVAKGVLMLLEHYPAVAGDSTPEDTGPVLSESELLLVAKVVDGKNFRQIRMAAHNDITDDSLRTKLLNKTALTLAVEIRAVSVDDDGVYHSLLAVEDDPQYQESAESAAAAV